MANGDGELPIADCRVTGALALAGLVLAAAAAGAQVIDRVLASVDGRLITLSDVRVTRALGLVPGTGDLDQEVERWIERLLMLQEVDRFAPPEPDAAAIEAATREAVARLGPPADASARLALLGVNEEWVGQWVRDDLRIRAYIHERFAGAAEPGSEELENYYRQHPAEFMRDGREMPAADAQALARERVMAARRQVLTADWLDGLRRRATIVKPRR
jgi:hypothetical protein